MNGQNQAANTNVNFMPWNDIPDEDVLPTGCYHMVVEDMEDGMSNNQKRMPRARFGVKAPQEYVGMSHFENYVLGTDENPRGINAGTFGARNLKKMLVAAQVPASNDMQAICMSAKGAELLVSITMYIEKDGEYAGSKRNRVVSYDRLGAKQVGIAPGQGGAGVAGMTPPAVSAPQPPAAPPMNASGAPAQQTPPAMQPMQQPQQSAPQAGQLMGPPPIESPQMPQALGQTPPMQPAGPQPVTPPQMPQTAPQTAPQTPQMPPMMAPQQPSGPAPTPQAEGPKMTCSICQKPGAAMNFGAHVQDHSQGIIDQQGNPTGRGTPSPF